MRETLYSEVVQVANGSATGNPVDCPDAWLVVCNPELTVTGIIPQPGRYFVMAVLLKGRNILPVQIDSVLWTGYLGGDMASSFPNLRVNHEQAVTFIVFSGTNGTVANDGRLRFAFGFDTERPRGGAWIHSQQPFTGPGEPRKIQPGNPAAGSRATTAVPAQVRMKGKSFTCNFQAAAVAGNRMPDAGYGDGQAWAVSAIDKPITSGQAAEIFFGLDMGHQTEIASVYNQRVGSLPNFWATPGDILFVGSDNMNIADQITSPAFIVEEWAGPAA